MESRLGRLFDKLIEDVEPIPENYGGFVDNVRVKQTIYPAYLKNQRACMKSTRNNRGCFTIRGTKFVS